MFQAALAMQLNKNHYIILFFTCYYTGKAVVPCMLLSMPEEEKRNPTYMKSFHLRIDIPDFHTDPPNALLKSIQISSYLCVKLNSPVSQSYRSSTAWTPSVSRSSAEQARHPNLSLHLQPCYPLVLKGLLSLGLVCRRSQS